MAILSWNIWALIIPDLATIARVESFAEHWSKWEYATGWLHIPHLTLYFGHLNDVPISESKKLIDQLRKKITGLELLLDDVKVFWGQYLFWNSNIPESLREARQTSLQLSQYLDPDKRPVADWLSLTSRQSQNMSQYGHPLVGDDYEPHITLWYSPVFDSSNIPQSIPHTMTVQNVVFARMGKYWRVDEIIRDI